MNVFDRVYRLCKCYQSEGIPKKSSAQYAPFPHDECGILFGGSTECSAKH
jgi:hypothetical protein